MPLFNQLNYIDNGKILVGVFVILVMALGSFLGERSIAVNSVVSVPARYRTEIAVLCLCAVSIIMHLIMMSQLFLQPTLILEIIRQEDGAIWRVRNDAAKIAGLTSFTQVYIILFPLLGVYNFWYERPPSVAVLAAVTLLVFLMFIRAFALAERLILIEAAVMFALPYLSFGFRRRKLITFLPVFGFMGIVVLFAVGEYFRSWPFYKDSYNSYSEFVLLRMSGYVVTATNAGAGIIDRIGTTGYPYITALWFWRFPFVDTVFTGGESPVATFLRYYGNAEFNNPSGIFAGIVDYGIFVGLIFYFSIGIVVGRLYTSFRIGGIISIVIFPIFFMALLELTQLFYLGDSRLFTPLIISIPVIAYLARGTETHALEYQTG